MTSGIKQRNASAHVWIKKGIKNKISVLPKMRFQNKQVSYRISAHSTNHCVQQYIYVKMILTWCNPFFFLIFYCLEVKCGTPPTDGNAYTPMTSGVYNDQFTYTCLPGFLANGDSTYHLDCQQSGLWSGPPAARCEGSYSPYQLSIVFHKGSS